MNFTFRRLQRADLPMLGEWLARPHVQKWWLHDPAPEAVEADFGGRADGTEPTEYFIVSLDEQEMGFVQRYRIGDYPEWIRALQVIDCPPDAVGIDYFISEPGLVGRGIGTAMIGRFQLLRPKGMST